MFISMMNYDIQFMNSNLIRIILPDDLPLHPVGLSDATWHLWSYQHEAYMDQN